MYHIYPSTNSTGLWALHEHAIFRTKCTPSAVAAAMFIFRLLNLETSRKTRPFAFDAFANPINVLEKEKGIAEASPYPRRVCPVVNYPDLVTTDRQSGEFTSQLESRFHRGHKFSEGAAEAPLSTREIESPRRNHVREKICIKEERTAAVPLKMSEIYLVGEPSCSDIKHDLARTSGSCYSTLYRNPFPLTPRLYQGATVTPVIFSDRLSPNSLKLYVVSFFQRIERRYETFHPDNCEGGPFL